MIGIVDYGAGNLKSVMNALEYLGVRHLLINDPRRLRRVERIILPGVGAFGSAVKKLKISKLFEPVIEWLRVDRPFLGICLGLQLLFESSEEAKGIRGFGIFKGCIRRFRRYKIPQIGWNRVEIVRNSLIFDSTKDNPFFYFLHSYYLTTKEKDAVIGVTEYGVRYASVINRGNIYAVQFHPEKSGRAGIQLLKNWVEKC